MNILNNIDVSYLKKILFETEQLQVVHSSVYEKIPVTHLALFGYHEGIYCFPTIELADWLSKTIDLTSTIEIGSGHGALAKYLKIPATDSKLMETPEIATYYKIIKQPVTKYPVDVIKLDAVSAIKHFKPKCVIGCWITHLYKESEHKRGGNMYGIDEEWIVKNVEKYIVIGNENVHKFKKILELPHKEYKFPWLYSRSLEKDKNIIYVWENKTRG